MSADLWTEYVCYARAAGPRHDAALMRLGVPGNWLRQGASRYGVATVRPEGRLWIPDREGVPACILPAEPLADLDDPMWAPPQITDLIAFRTAAPGAWWSRTGAAVLLAPEEVERAQHYAAPLMVHADPLAWLRAAGRGVVVLAWDAFLPLRLGGPSALVCGDLATAERLDHAMNARHRPHRIGVLADVLEAAE